MFQKSLSAAWQKPGLTSLVVFIVGALITYKVVESLTTKKKTHALPPPPTIKHRIPLIGHLISFLRTGLPYYVTICASMPSVIGTVHFPGKEIYVIHPDRNGGTKGFAQTRERSLMAGFWLAYDKAIGLSPSSRHWMCLPDENEFRKALVKTFKEQFLDLGNLKHCAVGLHEKVDIYWNERFSQGTAVKLNLGAWIYDDLLRAFSALFWDGDGPFQDAELRAHTSVFLGNLHKLMAPMEFLNSREGRASRTFVRNKLDTGHDHVTESLVDENGKPAEPTGLLAAIRQLLYKWDAYNPHAWVDYQISVVAVVLQNIATAVLWTLIHILTNPALKAEVIKEVNSILEPRDGDEQSSGSFVIDASKFRESCPHLAATWYEMLRWNGAVPVARYVTDDTVFASQYTLKKGGIMVSPMAVRHFDPEIWGADPHEFRAERLLREDGKLNMDLIRQLGTFGIPGVGVCPGRYLAFNVAMSMLAKILISFDITYPEGGLLARGQVPKPKTHLSLGMSEPEQDAEAVLKRRVGIAAVKVDFENIKPGW